VKLAPLILSQEHFLYYKKNKQTMREHIQDNIYPVGASILAKENPTLRLTILKYYDRIYYCSVADDPDHKHFAYFERELIPTDEFK
jgi:hypothetical protein